MASATLYYSFPYPTDTDPVDVPADMKLLADSIDSDLFITVSTASVGAIASASAALASHEADTTNIHGISNTALLATITNVSSASAAAVSSANSYTVSAINSASPSIIAAIVNSAPSTLDTLNEIATALGNDASFATTITSSLAEKLSISSASTLYLTQASASSTYLTNASASSTYQPVDGDLTAIAALSGTNGFLKKTGTNTWSVDSSTYITGNQTVTLSGDVTGSGSTSITTTLANSGVSAATYGSASVIPVVEVDVKGRITSATNTNIAISQSAVTNLTSDLALKSPLASPTFTGTVTVPTPSNSTDAATKGYVDTTTTNTQSASYALVIADTGKTIEMNSGSANNLTVPPNSSVAFPVGTRIEIIQYGAGKTTIVAGAGVTIRSRDNYLSIYKQYSGASLYKRATDEWVLVGDLVA
jgi:hypothetical protein